MRLKRRSKTIRAITFIGYQIMGSVLFVGLAWIAIQADRGQTELRALVSTETEASGWLKATPVTAWVSDTAVSVWGEIAHRNKTTATPYASGWYAPLAQATVQRTFGQTGKGIVLQAKQSTEVIAVGDGEVIFCAPPEQDAIGWTVVVAHKDETKSIYGMLDQASVRVGDKVTGGQSIGWINKEEEDAPSTLYFAFKQGSLFLDPEAVIGFD